MDLDILFSQAQAVRLQKTGRPHRWALLWPVYAVLRSRGYSCQRAVQWLASHRAVPAGEEDRALHAFHVLTTRRRKKARQQLRKKGAAQRMKGSAENPKSGRTAALQRLQALAAQAPVSPASPQNNHKKIPNLKSETSCAQTILPLRPLRPFPGRSPRRVAPRQ